MPQSSWPTKRPHEHPSDSNKLESPSDSEVTEAHRKLTFPLRWRFYSLVFFLVIGTSGSIFLGFTISEILFGRILGSPLAMWWEWLLYFISPTVLLVWFGARLVQDFRARVTFTPAGISLHTPRYTPTLAWATPQREHQTFTWSQIRHIEVLSDVIAVQFPTTAVVLHPTPQQHAQFLALTQTCLVQTKVVMEAQVLQDFWSRPRHFSVWESGISSIIFYGSVGALVSLLMAAVFFETSWLFGPVFLVYLGGYLLIGGLKETTVRRRLVLTTNGVIDGSFPKPKMLGFFHNVPTFDSPGVLSRDKPVLVPWIPWPEITNFRRSGDDDAIVFESSQGELEIWGLAKRIEVKELIWQQIGTEHVAEELSVYT